MSDLTRTSERLRPVRLERPIRLRLWTTDWYRIAVGFAVLGLTCEVLLAFQLARDGFTPAAWAWFLGPNLLVLPPAIAWTVRRLGPHRHTLVLREKGLEYHRPGVPTVEVPYGRVTGYWIQEDAEAWLRVETDDGRRVKILGREAAGEIPKDDIVRILGPRVPEWAIQGRGTRPDDPVLAKVWDTYGDPPPVPMVPGRRYRYLGKSATPETVAIWSVVPLQVMMTAISTLRMARNRFPEDRLFYLSGLLFALAMIGGIVFHARRLQRSKDDRFETVPEGLRIIRGDRSWVVTNPRPVSFSLCVKRHHRHGVLRYGRGFGSYDFDPRLIEEDD